MTMTIVKNLLGEDYNKTLTDKNKSKHKKMHKKN